MLVINDMVADLNPQYTSDVTEEYKEATSNRLVRYTISKNIENYPELREQFNSWRDDQKDLQTPSFDGIFHHAYGQALFDIRNAEIREDWGQRNTLTEKGRASKILGMAKNFNPKLFQPISVDYIKDENQFIIRDGAGRAHAAYLCGVYSVPATVRHVDNFEESRFLFNAQDKYSAAISTYDKFLQQILDSKHPKHNQACDLWKISKSSGFVLHHSDASVSTPLIDGISILYRTIRKAGGDAKDVRWGEKTAPNLAIAVDVLKTAFPANQEIPASVIEAVVSFIHISKNRIPSGQAGKNRLEEFICEVRDSETALQDITNWTCSMDFDSSNNYGTYGAASLMEKWNALCVPKNRGIRKGSKYRWAKWEAHEISTTRTNLIQFAIDQSLFPKSWNDPLLSK